MKVIIIILFVIFFTTILKSDPIIKTENHKFDIEISPGITISTTVHILDNSLNTTGQNIVCIHGFAHTSTTYESWFYRTIPLEEFNSEISKVILVDLPGRIKSDVPPKDQFLFGELTLEHYVLFIKQVFDYLQAQGISRDIIIAHSMGAMLIQLFQNQLIGQEKSLSLEYNVKKILLMAPTLPIEISWLYADNGIGMAKMVPYLQTDQNYGTYINLPDKDWIDIFFSNSEGEIITEAPSPSEVISLQYNSIESLTAAAQLLGIDVDRPSIQQNIFNNKGTTLWIATFSEDPIFIDNPGVHEELYQYLTGDTDNTHLITIEKSYAVHDYYILNDTGLDMVLLDILLMN